MRIKTFDGKRYIALGDFDHLRHNLVRDIYDDNERDENGQYHLSDYDSGRIAAYTHIMTEILIDEIHDCESPDEIRQLYKRIRNEYLRDKYCIVYKDDETNEILFFRKYCEHINEGEETPVFTGMKRLAKDFDDHYVATCTLKRIEMEYEDLKGKLSIKPLDLIFTTKEDADRLLRAIFGSDETEKEGE